MKLLVVIVSYKVTDLTIGCLRSLQHIIAEVPGARVAVCENGTGDQAINELTSTIEKEEWSAWVSLTAITPNRGFTGGNNVIIRAALASADPPEYFLLLNADTIVRPNALKALVDFADSNPAAGICGSRMENLEGVPRSTAFRFFSIASEFDNGMRLGLVSKLLRPWTVTRPMPTHACQTDWVSGASMLVRRQVFEEIGLLDEELYTYFDDIDICMRAYRAGWSTWWIPESHVVHFMGQTTGVTQRNVRPKRRPDYWFQARRLFWLKNYGKLRTALADTAWIAGFSLWRFRRAITRKPDADPPHFLLDSIRHSVFFSGFRKHPVPNPAFRQTTA